VTDFLICEHFKGGGIGGLASYGGGGGEYFGIFDE
jgi:hypothetical protein